MGQAVSDVLPIDAGSQKFAAAVDPSDGQFTLPWAVGAQTFSSKEYAALGVLPIWKTDTTHSALSVTTTPVKRGASGSSTAGVDARGFNKCTAFMSISGLVGAASLSVRQIRRYTQTGSDFVPAETIASALTNGYNAVTFDVDAPYLMIEAEASSGTATVTINLYLHRG